MIVRTEPEAFSVVEDLATEIRFHFDERISEQISGGTFADAVSVSPRGGELRVRHDSRTLSVRVAGGLRPGIVYRVTVLPLISDLFGNQLRDPFELVFSTGAEPAPTTVAGEVWDRISGQGVSGAQLQAVGSDSLVYLATADAQGIFAFRYLPPGAFTITAFEDTNRDGEVGPREVKGSRGVALAVGDTLLVDLAVLPPDTTQAALARASALDSVTVVLEFDDYIDPEADASAVTVTLDREEGSAPDVTRLFLEHEYAAYVTRVTDSLRAVAPPPAAAPPAVPPADTTAVGAVTPDTAAAPDTAGTGGPARDTTGAGRPGVTLPTGRGGRGGRGAAAGPVPGAPPALPGARGGGGGRGQAQATPPDRVLPGRRIVALLDAPLEVDVEYQVSVGGVVNVNSMGGGGGEATLVLPAPPEPPEAAAPDSTGAPLPPPSDSTRSPGGAPPADTLGAGARGR